MCLCARVKTLKTRIVVRVDVTVKHGFATFSVFGTSPSQIWLCLLLKVSLVSKKIRNQYCLFHLRQLLFKPIVYTMRFLLSILLYSGRFNITTFREL